MRYVRSLIGWAGLALNLALAGCGSGVFVSQLNVRSANPASGVTITVGQNDRTGAGSGVSGFTREYSIGSTVTLTAPSTASGNSFAGWSGCTSTNSVTCTVTFGSSSLNPTVTANYSSPAPLPVYVLTVNSINPASGVAIGVSPADNNGAAGGATAFTRTYTAGSQVTLTAPATTNGNVFTSWTGCASATSTTCLVTINANTTVSANYAAPSLAPSTYQLAVTATNAPSGVSVTTSSADSNGLSGGTTNFVRTYAAGTTVALTVPAALNGEPFLYWTGCSAASTVTCVVNMNSNVTVTANYQPAPTLTPTYVLVVTSTNPSGGVAIAASPKDNNGASAGLTNLALNYNAGTAVTLTAPSNMNGNPFVSWSGCTSAVATNCTVQMNSNTTITANYIVPPPAPVTYQLAVNSANPATGVNIAVSPIDNTNASNGPTSFTRTYNVGTSVTLVAPATAGSNTFSSWTGCLTASSVTCTVYMNSNMAVTANYATPPPAQKTNVLTVNSINPPQGVGIAVSPADANNAANGATGFTRTYVTGSTVTLTAQSTWGNNPFASWSGCTKTTTVTCTVVLNADTSVTANYNTPAPVTHVLTVNSSTPASGVAIGAAPNDNNGASNGSTTFTRIYNTGTAVTLTAPNNAGGYPFVSWTGCTTVNGNACGVTMNADNTVTAAYSAPSILSVTISPNPANVVIGQTQQFTATVTGTGNYSSAVTWSISAPSGSTLSPGTVTSGGLFTSSSPSPSTVTITATSVQNPTVSGSVTATLEHASADTGPALTVDVGNKTRPISPNIYGMNAYLLDLDAAQTANIPLTRWGGDAASRYNYQLDVTNTAADYFFENRSGETADGQNAVAGSSAFNALVANNKSIGAATLGTVPVLGWVAKDGTSCSFPQSLYPNQYAFDIYFPCGDGENYDQSYITGNNPLATSIAVGPSWVGGWVSSLVSKFGKAANGGVAYYDLDNEPSWWDVNHHDVHPVASTYDEVTNNGISTAAAIKAADPTAQVNGPVVDYWWNYFYSKKDIEAGWATGPCGQQWDNPIDRNAHGGVPFIQYYLQQFAAYQAAHGVRLLDYLDLHGYFSAYYPADSNNQTGLTTAGDIGEQEARVDSTRALWDPTYTDPHYPQPNYKTDPNYTTDYCIVPLQAPQLIPMMQSWIAQSYPGTKTSISEYNWGGQESINGAVAQADVLGIFGAYGLDMATLWAPPNPITQMPGLLAFEIYRNYDGKKSTFGDEALASKSVNQGQLSVYGAQRTSDGAITIVIINKTYGDLQSSLSLANYAATAGQTAQLFQYSNANLAAITPMPSLAITPPANGGTTSTITATFPGQSISLIVIPAH